MLYTYRYIYIYKYLKNQQKTNIFYGNIFAENIMNFL